MKVGKLIVGYSFISIGIGCSIVALFLLYDDRLNTIFQSQQNIKIEVALFLVFSLLLSFSGFKTIQKEYKKNKLKQSELLDD